MRRLAYEPWSLHRTRALGGKEWYGYSITDRGIANIEDRLALLTKAAAQNKASLKDKDRAPRPTYKAKARTISSRDTNAVAQIVAALG